MWAAAGKWDGGVGQTAAVLAMAFSKKGSESVAKNPFRPAVVRKLTPEEEAEESKRVWGMFNAAMQSKFGKG